MAETRRLFFALWPADHIRQAIVQQTKASWQDKSKPVKASNLHMTLIFLGNVTKEKLNDFLYAANKVEAQTFELELNQPGSFRRPQVLWLGCSKTPDALPALVSQLGKELAHYGFNSDDKPYVPHVTLARKYKLQDLPDFSCRIQWPVKEFSLVESKSTANGVEYSVLQSWSLVDG